MWARTFLSVVSVVGFALASSQSWGATSFGAKLDSHTQPANSSQGIFCSNSKPDCTWVLMQARNCEFGSCNHGELAPKDGTIAQIRLIACTPGSFVLQIAQVNPANKKQAKVIRSGPMIVYKGDSQQCEGDTFQIQTFNVNVPVKKGNYLAIATESFTFGYCSGGGNNSMAFNRPLADGGAYRTNTKTEGCMMLLQAIYKS